MAEDDKAINVANFFFTSQLLQKKLDARFSLLPEFINARYFPLCPYALTALRHLFITFCFLSFIIRKARAGYMSWFFKKPAGYGNQRGGKYITS
ncbi:hypothetical protein [Chimaeribacter arupi]|uniref:hypothetical protein n=1 Tax=Chimaeribacter arupi TaxID=2060066 RepID=UPI0011AEEE18|nr:hypothetical protein [Chimaeribacter arupi]MDV5139557.1 hypothetical protein [Chimaeribacter arupi]